MDTQRYHSLYSPDAPYGRAVGLLEQATRAPRTGVVLDLGCGFGAVAEPVRDLGFTYIGVDTEQDGLADLAGRGFATAVVDLSDTEGLGARLGALLGGRPLGGVMSLDVIEHLTVGAQLLATVRTLCAAHGDAPLVVSIPNVTHVDLAAKLLLGRWDVTPVGLLDVTHVSLYSPARLETTFAQGGWLQVGADDFVLAESDQHTPPDAATMAPTPLRALIAQVRSRAAPASVTNQFVRAYRPAPPVAPPSPGAGGPALSVVLLAGAGGPPSDLLLCLDAQRSRDFEVVCCAPRGAHGAFADALAALSPDLGARTVVVDAPADRGRGLAAAIAAATGRHLTVLDGRSLVYPHFVETFARLGAEHPEAVLRALALAQPVVPEGGAWRVTGPAAPTGRARFLLAEHLFETASPPGSYALPRSAFADLGFSVDAAVPGAEEESLLLEVAMLCGVHEAPGEVVTLRRRPVGEPPETTTEDARRLLAQRLDAGPLLLPAGSVAALWDAREALRLARDAAAAPRDPSNDDGRVARLEAMLARCEQEIAELRASTSWRVTAPLRRLGERRAR